MKNTEAVFLTETEFMVLCSLCGLKTIRCLPLPDPAALGKEDLTMALWHLVKEGYLRADGDRFLPGEKAVSLTAPLNSQTVLVLTPVSGAAQKMCYPGTMITVIERDRFSREMIRLESLTPEEFREEMDGLLGGCISDTQDGEMLLSENILCRQEYEELIEGRKSILESVLEAKITGPDGEKTYRFLRGSLCLFVVTDGESWKNPRIYDTEIRNRFPDIWKEGVMD